MSEPRRDIATAGGLGASPLLAVEGLHKTYRMGDEDLRVLRGVEIALKPGEWVAVLGASGSGKSTLLHLMGGLDHPDAGAVRFRGEDVFSAGERAVDRYRRRHVGLVFQFYHLLPELDALENVVLGAMIDRPLWRWRGEGRSVRERARALLDSFGLTGRLTHRPNRLSGGERQRVAIARALINGPELLLADEPTGNLDAATGAQIIEVLQGLHAGARIRVGPLARLGRRSLCLTS